MPRTIESCIKSARRAYKLERRELRGGEVSWMAVDRSGVGRGVIGTKIEGEDYLEKTVMFHALKSFDPKYDWHDHDWHTLGGPAESRCRQMIAWRMEREAAAEAQHGFRTLALLMAGQVRAAARKGSANG